jgi:hypothetical protein
VTCCRFSPGTPVSCINKIECYKITEILLKVALNTIILAPQPLNRTSFCVQNRQVFGLYRMKDFFHWGFIESVVYTGFNCVTKILCSMYSSIIFFMNYFDMKKISMNPILHKTQKYFLLIMWFVIYNNLIKTSFTNNYIKKKKKITSGYYSIPNVC